MTDETKVARRTSTSTPSQRIASDAAVTHGKKPKPKVKERLSFLRPENLLSPSEPNYIAPTAQQILDLAAWAGLEGGGKGGAGALAKVARVEEFQMRRWCNTNKSIENVSVIPGPVWRYMLIRLGVIEQPTFRRAEPPTVDTQTFSPEGRESLTLRAKIWYQTRDVVVDLYDDSTHSVSRKDKKPIFSFTLECDVSASAGNTIDNYLRHDDFSVENNNVILAAMDKAYKANRLKEEDVQYYSAFIEKSLWGCLWRLHDFYSINPRDFLNTNNLDPFDCPEDEMPDHRKILSVANWAGVKKSDLAYIGGEQADRMNWLSSGRGQKKYQEAKAEFDKGNLTAKDLSGIRWANQISRHAWALILSAYGLGPQIPVVGRNDPRARKVRTFTFKEVAGVPVDFLKVETSVSFADAAMSKLVITGRFSTHQGTGKEWSESFRVTQDLEGNLFIDNAITGKNTTAPTSWEKLVNRVPHEAATTYMEKAVWHHVGTYIRHFFIN